jgi:hypothetical protein
MYNYMVIQTENAGEKKCFIIRFTDQDNIVFIISRFKGVQTASVFKTLKKAKHAREICLASYKVEAI